MILTVNPTAGDTSCASALKAPKRRDYNNTLAKDNTQISSRFNCRLGQWRHSSYLPHGASLRYGSPASAVGPRPPPKAISLALDSKHTMAPPFADVQDEIVNATRLLVGRLVLLDLALKLLDQRFGAIRGERRPRPAHWDNADEVPAANRPAVRCQQGDRRSSTRHLVFLLT